ncbi:LOW QUALITY PROTEIN: hypothetical protein Cgig2_025352 [Carnegiea gigantea]|uniref:Uncharacterized protein n=1 Tax=Carnegiea gigantea TaxID=171969 RepID=A0A9Q1GL96_9CARY|nr:LOW QUALITY PROTEIN: hypothetical protein Cgig2_025352 [Carnegiea gigantea]
MSKEKLREERSYTVPFWPAGQQKAASLPLTYARQRPPLVQEWHPQSRRPSAEPSLDLHKTNRKSILKDQKAGCGEKEVRLSITRLVPSLLGPFHRFNRLSHEPRDGPRPIFLAYIKHEFVIPQPWVPRRGSEPICPRSNQERRPNLIPSVGKGSHTSTFIKPGLLLKQYHPKSSVSLGALWTVMQGKTETVVEGCPVYCYTLGGWLIHGGIWFGNHEGVLGAPGNSDPSATISVTGGVRPFRLGTEPPGPNDDSGLLVVAPLEDELLEEYPEAKLGEPDREEVLELEEATSASGLDSGGTEQGLPNVPSARSSSECWGWRNTHSWTRGSARLKKGNDIGNLFRLPILILSGDSSHHSTINKGREVGKLRVPTLHLGASLALRDGQEDRPILKSPLGRLKHPGHPFHPAGGIVALLESLRP